MKWFCYAILLINTFAGAMFIMAKLGDNLPAGDYISYAWLVLSIGGFVLTLKDDFMDGK